MKIKGLLIVNILIVVIVALYAASCSTPEKTESLDKQAQEIYRSLMCPLCSGQTIYQSQTQLSAQMRSLVREKLEQGETREEILQFFVERYGETVLAAPVKSGFNLIVWVTPILGILAGGIVFWIIIRRWRQGGNKSELASPVLDDKDDAKYREQIEKELQDFEERGFR